MNPGIAIDKDLKIKINEEQKNESDVKNIESNAIENNENVTNNTIATSAVIHFPQIPTLVTS
jgi:hypothetical protein